MQIGNREQAVLRPIKRTRGIGDEIRAGNGKHPTARRRQDAIGLQCESRQGIT
jgi:hypothetical protein